mgnify:CR=1 FL=1
MDGRKRTVQIKFRETEAERDEAKEELKVISDSISDLEKTSQALLALYNLQQEYLTGNLDGCLLTLQEISDQHLDELLPSTNTEGVTPPAQRYQELKEAIFNK